MVSDGTEFAVGYIEKSFEEARRNTKTKQEKFEKYNRRRRDVQIKVNDWVMVATQPSSSATTKVVAKFKPKFEGPYRVLYVKNNNVVIWKAGKRLTINIDQVRIYRHRKCDETEIRTGSSDNGSAMNRVVLTEYNGDQMSREMRGRHNKEDQFDPEKAEEGMIAPTSKNEQDQATRMPDEMINNGKTRKGEKPVRKVFVPGGLGRKVIRNRFKLSHIQIMFDPSSFTNPTPLAHADTSRDVLPWGGTSQAPEITDIKT
ncbi:uncharacterized protein TNCV_1763771 [Trichonephila clavipes]|nr:uncharacterized protein TNCV_1763771 [Trichonephila clavipes]